MKESKKEKFGTHLYDEFVKVCLILDGEGLDEKEREDIILGAAGAFYCRSLLAQYNRVVDHQKDRYLNHSFENFKQNTLRLIRGKSRAN